MPNHVYSKITVEDKYIGKLAEITKVGLMQYYKPMPIELDVKAPNRDHESAEHLTDTYGYPDWYSWRNANWGTKWAEYDVEDSDENSYCFSTAWNPVKGDIIQMLLKDIPSLSYSWEEEQGFGEEYEYENGEQTYFLEYGLPKFEYTPIEAIDYLTEDYTNAEGMHPSGYYSDLDLSSFLSRDFEEAKVILDNREKKLELDCFMHSIRDLPLDPLLLDKFLHEGFTRNLDTLNLFLKESYAQ